MEQVVMAHPGYFTAQNRPNTHCTGGTCPFEHGDVFSGSTYDREFLDLSFYRGSGCLNFSA